MHDDPTLGELLRRLDRAEQACERRAAAHVDRDLYFSERDTIRGDVSEIREALASVRSDLTAEAKTRQQALQTLEDGRARDRRMMVAGVVVPVLGMVVAVVIGLLA